MLKKIILFSFLFFGLPTITNNNKNVEKTNTNQKIKELQYELEYIKAEVRSLEDDQRLIGAELYTAIFSYLAAMDHSIDFIDTFVNGTCYFVAVNMLALLLGYSDTNEIVASKKNFIDRLCTISTVGSLALLFNGMVTMGFHL